MYVTYILIFFGFQYYKDTLSGSHLVKQGQTVHRNEVIEKRKKLERMTNIKCMKELWKNEWRTINIQKNSDRVSEGQPNVWRNSDWVSKGQPKRLRNSDRVSEGQPNVWLNSDWVSEGQPNVWRNSDWVSEGQPNVWRNSLS